MAVAKSAWETSHVHLEIVGLDEPAARDGAAAGSGTRRPVRVRALGNATFLRLPKLLDQLEALPKDREVELDLTGLRHLDHACAAALGAWEEQRRGPDGTARKEAPSVAP